MSSATVPLHPGSPAEFTVVREFFRQADFQDATLCRVLSLGDMSDLGRVQWANAGLESLAPSLRWCLQTFVRGLSSAEDEARAICGDAVFAAFHSLGLLRPSEKTPANCVCPVWVYPAAGFVIVTDRRDDPEGGELVPAEDIVFPAIYAGTLRFLQLLPEARGGDALDLCGGSGIGALQLARTARTAATADLTRRSALFAEFNSRLNGVDMQSLCGDLYAPVEGRQFDLIAAHPPFVPSMRTDMVYRDGGETGEEITRRVIKGLPAHLRPGGTCMILCVARDTKEQALEHRVREWLGSAADEFDIIFGLEKILSVEEVIDSLRKRGQQIAEAGARQLQERLHSLGTSQFVYGAIFIRRGHESAAKEPCRVRLTLAGAAPDFEHLLQWRRFCRQPGFPEWLAAARPRLSPALRFTIRHAVHEGSLTPVDFVFEIEAGFHAALRLDGWVVPLIAQLEGGKAVNEVYSAAMKEEKLPAGFKLEDFLELVRGMIDRGFLSVETP